MCEDLCTGSEEAVSNSEEEEEGHEGLLGRC